MKFNIPISYAESTFMIFSLYVNAGW